jgi:S1-C subfamily serine protease
MKHHRTTLVIGACGLAIAAILGFAGTGSAPRLNGSQQQAAAPAANMTIADLVSHVSHSIVRVSLVRENKTKIAQTGNEVPDFTWEAGTGFVIRCDRTGGNDTTDNVEFDVVTNNHVLQLPVRDWTGPARLFCLLYGVTTTKATIVGTDLAADLAVIRVQAQAPKDRTPRALAWADPSTIHVGDKAVAIGYARNLKGRPTVTQGIVGAIGRTEPTTGADQGQFANLLQTDAAINHGNSGGPLLNLRGEVMGVNTYLISPTVTKDPSGNIAVDTTVGIYFARSSATAKPFVEQIVQHGRVTRPALGAGAVTIAEAFEQYYNWPLGARITTVTPGSLAANVGLKPGDIVTAVGSAAQRPDQPDASQETKIATTGEFNDQVGLRAGDGSLWVRYIRPPGPWLAAVSAGQFPRFTAGEPSVAYLR